MAGANRHTVKFWRPPASSALMSSRRLGRLTPRNPADAWPPILPDKGACYRGFPYDSMMELIDA